MKLTMRLDLAPFKLALSLGPAQLSAVQVSNLIHQLLSQNCVNSQKSSRRLDFLFHEFMAAKDKAADPIEGITLLNDYLFTEKALTGCDDEKTNCDHYFIAKVLETRTGAPIAMALIYREIAKRVGYPIEFINFPGHSFVKLHYQNQLVFLDPAGGGRALSVADLQKKLSGRFGKEMFLNGSILETPTENQILISMLGRLKNIYFEQRRWTQFLAVLDMLIALNPSHMSEYRERGLLLYQLGNFDEAFADLRFFVDKSPPSPDIERLRSLFVHLGSHTLQ